MTSANKLLLYRALHSYIKAGFDIAKACEMAASSEDLKAPQRQLLREAARRLKAGTSLHRALAKVLGDDNPMLEVASRTGNYDAVLRYLIWRNESQQTLLARFKSKLLFPVIILLLGGSALQLPLLIKNEVSALGFICQLMLPVMLFMICLKLGRSAYTLRFRWVNQSNILKTKLLSFELQQQFLLAASVYQLAGIDFYQAAGRLATIMPNRYWQQQVSNKALRVKTREQTAGYYFASLPFISKAQQQRIHTGERAGALSDELQQLALQAQMQWQQQLEFLAKWLGRSLYPLALGLLFTCRYFA